MSSSYKLIYFAGRGLAETSRMLFKVADQAFEDYRYPLTIDNGQYLRPEWDADKSKYIYEQIPVLEIDGGKYTLSQSKAIERFLARRFNLLGNSDVEAALIGKMRVAFRREKKYFERLVCIDAAGEQITDVRTAFNKAKAAGDDAVKKFFDENLKKSFAAFEKQADKNQSGYWIGARLSLFDIQLYNLIQWFEDQETVQKLLAGYPALKAIYNKVEETPAIKKWLEERPKTPF